MDSDADMAYSMRSSSPPTDHSLESRHRSNTMYSQSGDSAARRILPEIADPRRWTVYDEHCYIRTFIGNRSEKDAMWLAPNTKYEDLFKTILETGLHVPTLTEADSQIEMAREFLQDLGRQLGEVQAHENLAGTVFMYGQSQSPQLRLRDDTDPQFNFNSILTTLAVTYANIRDEASLSSFLDQSEHDHHIGRPLDSFLETVLRMNQKKDSRVVFRGGMRISNPRNRIFDIDPDFETGTLFTYLHPSRMSLNIIEAHLRQALKEESESSDSDRANNVSRSDKTIPWNMTRAGRAVSTLIQVVPRTVFIESTATYLTGLSIILFILEHKLQNLDLGVMRRQIMHDARACFAQFQRLGILKPSDEAVLPCFGYADGTMHLFTAQWSTAIRDVVCLVEFATVRVDKSLGLVILYQYLVGCLPLVEPIIRKFDKLTIEDIIHAIMSQKQTWSESTSNRVKART